MTTNGELPLRFGVVKAPKDAPDKVLRRCDSEAMAVGVSMAAAGCKLAYIAAMLGVSVAMVSRYRSGERHMPETRVQAFCNAIGSNLLRQYRDLQELIEDDQTARLAAMLRECA